MNKTTKRNVARYAALTSAVTILATGASIASTANAATIADLDGATYAVDTTDGNGQKFEGGTQQGQQYGWSFVGDACLTPGATGNGPSCANDKMVGWNGDPQRDKGWIQLTDARMAGPEGAFGSPTTWKNGQNIGGTGNGNQRGSALFNTNIPSSRGLDIQFTQVQGGGSTRRMWSWHPEIQNWGYFLDPTRGADGIGFYLVDGDKTTNLTKPGTYGAGLGYTQGTADSGQGAEAKIDMGVVKPWEDPSRLVRSAERGWSNNGVVDAVNGVDNGVIGVGIDAFGNNASRKYGQGYTVSDAYRVPGGEMGYSWEQAALATATDNSGKQACVREPHPNTNPRLNVDLGKAIGDPLGYGAEVLQRILNGDCTLVGLIPVKAKAAQFGELPYNDGFDPMGYRNGRFVDNGISYWEPRTDALTLRGPGNGIDGYQLLATRGYKGASKDQGELSTAFGVRSFRAQTNNMQLANAIDQAARALEGGSGLGALTDMKNLLALPGLNTLNQDGFNVHPSSTYYKYFRVTIDPVKDVNGNVRVTVAASNTPGQFPTSGGPTNAYLESSIPAKYIPDTYKFGFSASTGAGTDVHAIRDVKIKALEGGLSLEKSVSIDGGKNVAAVGDKLNYAFKVTNTGEAQLQNVGISDPILDAPASCDSRTLDPGASTNCVGVHVLTADDVANKGGKKFTEATARGLFDSVGVSGGTFDASAVPNEFTSGVIEAEKFVNTAVAYGFNGDTSIRNNGLLFSNLDNAEVPVSQPPVAVETPTPEPEPEPTPEPTPDAPSINVVKDVDKTSNFAKDVYASGDKVPYTFTVTNTGNVKLTDVKVTDKMFTEGENANLTCEATELAPGATTTCTGVHTLTDGEVAPGEFRNVAVAEGTPPGGEVVRDEDDETVPTDPERGLVLDKRVDETSDLFKERFEAGDKVPYAFTLTNNGKVELTNLYVEDEALDNPEDVKCEADSLAPGESTDCFGGVHTLTEDEVAQPEFVNIAQAFGIDPQVPNPDNITDPKDPNHPGRVPSNKDEAVVTFPVAPVEGLSLIKDVDTESDLAKSVYMAGDRVPYLFTVENTGNVRIDNIAVEDNALDEPAKCDDSALEPGEKTQCRGVHTLTEDEAAAGEFVNVAVATGTNPDGGNVRSNEDDEIVPTGTNKLTLVKNVDSASDLAKSSYAAGDKVPYIFTVTNAGPVEIHDVVVVDGALDEDAVCDATTLAPSASTDCRGVHTLTVEEAAAGKFINVAYASGLDPEGNPVNSNEDQAEVPTDAPRGAVLASTGASVMALAGVGGLVALAGAGLFLYRRRNV